MPKKIIIGDIHGCFDALKNIIEQSGYREGEDELIFVGDLFDRGTQSAEVFRYVSSLKEKNSDKVIIVYGNHEDMLVHSEDNAEEMECWDYNGAAYTKDSFENAGIEVSYVADWICENAVAYYECPEFYVCHGGTAIDDPAEVDLYDLVWDRDTFKNGTRNGKLMVIGHTPIRTPAWISRPDVQVYEYDVDYPLPKTGILNIDTACVYGGYLTAMIIKDGKFTLKGAQKSSPV